MNAPLDATPRYVRDPEPHVGSQESLLAAYEESARQADARAEETRDRLGELRRSIADDEAFQRTLSRAFGKMAGRVP